MLSWTVCLPGLSDRFESKKDRRKKLSQVGDYDSAGGGGGGNCSSVSL